MQSLDLLFGLLEFLDLQFELRGQLVDLLFNLFLELAVLRLKCGGTLLQGELISHFLLQLLIELPVPLLQVRQLLQLVILVPLHNLQLLANDFVLILKVVHPVSKFLR